MNDDKTKPTVPCPVCRIAWTADPPCPSRSSRRFNCRRWQSYGRIVETLVELHPGWPWRRGFLDALDAIADLMTEHAERTRAFSRQLHELESDAKDWARNSYAAGVTDERQKDQV